MNTRFTIFLSLGLGLLAVTGAAVVAPEAGEVRISRSASHLIESKAVGDRFVLQIRLPESYAQGSAKYPVIYLLDSDIWFGLATDITDNLAAVRESPEVIVVGIAYGRGIDDWWQKRARDYLPACERNKVPPDLPLAGGAARFREFLCEELFPYIGANFRIQENDRMLVGLSYGGLFAVETLLLRPELFQRYVIVAPSLHWDQEQIFVTEEANHGRHSDLSARVFLAWGEADGGAVAQARWARFVRQLEGRRDPGLKLSYHPFPDETHLSVFPVGFTRGLRQAYQGTGQ